GLDAQERLVRLRVARVDVVRVVGAAERRPQLPGDANRALGDARLLIYSMRLDLHEVGVFAEYLLVPACRFESLGFVPRGEEAADLGIEAAGKNEESVRMLGQQLAVHPRLVVEALEVGLGDEPDQVAVARFAPDQDRRVARALVAAVLPGALEAA